MRVPQRPWALWKMARPSHLALIWLVYLIGVGMAWRMGNPIDRWVVIAGFAALLPVAISVHYVNEYADVETDTRTSRTRFSGGSGALPRTGLPRWLAMAGAVGATVLAIVVLVAVWPAIPRRGVYLLTVIWVLGWQYSLGPLRFAWRGFGEVMNAVIGGIVLPLYGFAVVTGDVPVTTLVWVLPFGMLVFLNLLATQWPDRVADEAVGKRTLAVRWNASRLETAHRVGIVGWLAAVLLAGLLGLPVEGVLAYLVVAPAVVWSDRWFSVRESPLPAVLAMVGAAAGSGLAWWWPILG